MNNSGQPDFAGAATPASKNQLKIDYDDIN